MALGFARRVGLRTYRSDFSSFFSDAIPLLQADDLEDLLAAHTEHLIDQVTAHDDGDYGRAYQLLREADAHTEMLASALAGAIADQFPKRFPDTATARPGRVSSSVFCTPR